MEWLDQLKDGLEACRIALGVVRDVRDTLPAGKSTEAIDQAIEKAERATKIAEAQIAKGLGYPLCQCDFPPPIMLFQSYEMKPDGKHKIYRCSKCGDELTFSLARTRW
jgi:hypothetical protein